ncbi:MAG: rod-binding protein [Hyphomonadaceae bacterium]|nr:rod-binding protein [Hyphomonadaceae bacterium]
MEALSTPLPSPPLPASALARAPGADAREDALRKVATEFESMVLNELLAPMFAGLETDGLGGGGPGEAMFRPMLIERYAQSITAAGGIGVADAVMAELLRLQTGGPTKEPSHGADR